MTLENALLTVSQHAVDHQLNFTFGFCVKECAKKAVDKSKHFFPFIFFLTLTHIMGWQEGMRLLSGKTNLPKS